MLECPIISPERLLPHSGKMMLLERVVSYDEHSLLAHAEITPDHILLPDGAQALPAYLAAEIMAQGIGAWAGAHALDKGEAVRLGFLLGSRKLIFRRPDIPVGTKLAVWVQQSWQDDSGMGVFDCELRCREPLDDLAADTVLVSGAMNVYAPKHEADLNQLLAS
ncbi:thioester dehydrase [Neisseria lisongii]|uniref:Thioester dehydrase n=1 Tax=Neisseria lisongii TaxID=2912188 RepID=A0AAW5AJA7_9NEIS|nr:thioester dehydrase [Neisseria lisongii]MCF7529234.1 thioester dehydrase [Neisseria lisongii]